MGSVPINRTRALIIRTHPKDYRPTRAWEAAKLLLALANITEEEKQLANKALKGFRR